MKKTKVCFDGCGRWARRKYLPFLKKRPDVDVVAFCELVFPNERAEVSELFPKAKFYDTLDEMLEKEQVDGVVVTLPHSLHLSRILTSLKHGVSVFTDKPAGVSADEIKQIIAAEKKYKRHALVGCQRRALPGYVEMKKRFEQNDTQARWLTGNFYFSSYPNWEKTWRNDPKLSGIAEARQGVLLDSGYHLIDSALYILGFPKPKRVFAQANYREYNVDADVSVTVQCEGDLTLQFNVSRDAKESNQFEGIAILTDSQYLSFGLQEVNGSKHATFIQANGADPAIELHFPTTAVAQYPIDSFIRLLQGEDVGDRWSVKSSLPTLEIIDAAYQSIRDQATITL